MLGMLLSYGPNEQLLLRNTMEWDTKHCAARLAGYIVCPLRPGMRVECQALRVGAFSESK